MINVDIVGQLFPNVTTIIVQLLSTLVLFLAAKKFLYVPIKDMLSQRELVAQENLRKANEAKESALLEKERAKDYLQQSIDKANKIVDDAHADASKQKQEIIESAKKQAKENIEQANLRIEANKKAMLDQLQDDMVDIALEASKRLLQGKASEEQDRLLVEAFVKDLNNE